MKTAICIVKLNISDLAFTTPKIPAAREKSLWYPGYHNAVFPRNTSMKTLKSCSFNMHYLWRILL